MGLGSKLLNIFTGNIPGLIAETVQEKTNETTESGSDNKPSGLTSFIPGGGMIKKMANKKSAINSAQATQQPEQTAQEPIQTQEIQGFNLMDVLPQYANGGIPNKGNPALIMDLASLQPVGTMNEYGPESIVPMSTKNITTLPDINNSSKIDLTNMIANMPSMAPSQSIQTMVPRETSAGITDGTVNPATTAVFPSLTPEVSGSEKEKTLADNNFTKTMKNISPILRIIGYAADARRQNLGMGARKGLITSTLDWMDAQEQYQDKLKLASQKKKAKKELTPEEELALFKEKESFKAGLKEKGAKAEKEKKYEKEAYDQMQEDIKSKMFVGAEGEEPTEEEKNQYLKDYLKFRKEGKRPTYVEETKEEPRFGIGGLFGTKKTTEMVRKGYEDVTGNNTMDDQALEWAQANPDDPRSIAILKKLGG